MTRKRTVSVVVVAVAVITIGCLLVLRNTDSGPLNPVPDVSEAFIPLAFSCNGVDLLTQPIVLSPGEALQVEGKCRSRRNEPIRLRLVGFLMTILDGREVFTQSATLKTRTSGTILTFSCKSTAPKETGTYRIRAVMTRLPTGKSEILCQGKMQVK